MKYHIGVRSRWSGMGKYEAQVIECQRPYDAITAAYGVALAAIDMGADEVTDIEVITDEDWCANRWNEAYHFAFENMKMVFRMFRNEVQE